MKHIPMIVSVIALLLIVPCSTFSQESFAQQPEGAVLWGSSWYWRTITASGAIPALVNYQKDGSIIGADVSMFGGTAMNPYRYTPFHGIWERTGSNEFAGTSLFLRFDPATNKLVGIARSRSQFSFTDDFDHIAGTMRLDVLPCPTPATCPDPLAKDANWQPYNPAPIPNEFTFQAVRIRRVPISE